MNRLTFNVIFYIKRTKALKNNSLPIYARITVDGIRVEFVIQKNVPMELWDNGKGCAKGNTKVAKDINEYLDLIKSKICQHKLYFEERNEPITARGLRDKYMGFDSNTKTILGIFQEHNDRCKGLMNKDFAPGTVERYITCRKHVEDFIKLRYSRTDFALHEIKPAFIRDLEYYLKTERNCCHNTATKYLKNFKKIIRIALANGWMKSDPFSNIKFHLDEVDMAYLSKNELDILMKKEFAIDRLQLVRDIYLFCCFTGLAFIDVKTLKYEHIEDRDGDMWIKKRRQKTKNWCNVPLLPPALAIINKYKEFSKTKVSGFVLPVLSNQKMNAYLKEIADLCEIKKNLSTHTARHTFATTVALANGVSMPAVSKMIGHSGINTAMTQKYARVGDELIKNEMQKVFSKYDVLY